MAFQKIFPVPGGYTANYISFNGLLEYQVSIKYIALRFSLYRDAAAKAAGEPPAVLNFARVALSGAKFDEYFGNSVLGSADFISQAYAAAKVESVDMAIGSGALLADAQDV